MSAVEAVEPLETEAAAVAQLARGAAVPKNLDPSKPQALVVPADARLELPDLSAWRAAPVRKTGVYRPATVDSLIAYVDWQNREDDTTVWVHPTSGLITAVIDDNGDEPGYRQHRAVLNLTPTPEWVYWTARDGTMLSQEAFAEHVEGGLQQIEQPDAADVLELAQSFHATTSASFRSSIRLASGAQQLRYEEDVEASAGRSGELTVPTTIVLLLAPFLGEAEVQVVARFRFRVAGGKLTLGYKLEQPEKIVRDALEGIADKLGDTFPRVYLGEAPAAA